MNIEVGFCVYIRIFIFHYFGKFSDKFIRRLTGLLIKFILKYVAISFKNFQILNKIVINMLLTIFIILLFFSTNPSNHILEMLKMQSMIEMVTTLMGIH